MNVPEYREREAVSWLVGRERAYGVVLSPFGSDGCTVVRIYPKTQFVRCYDEGGADRARDAHNVLLRRSDDMFAPVRRYSDMGACYARCDKWNVHDLSGDDIAGLMLRHEFPGRLLDTFDFGELKEHLWRDEMQRTRPMSPVERLMEHARSHDPRHDNARYDREYD